MTIVLGLIQAIGLTVGLFRRAIVDRSAFNTITIIIVLTAGTAFLMWLGEQIDAFGIGNGISLLIMAGILARMPLPIIQLYKDFHDAGGLAAMKISGGEASLVNILMLAFLFFAVVTGVVFITLGQRRIPSNLQKYIAEITEDKTNADD